MHMQQQTTDGHTEDSLSVRVLGVHADSGLEQVRCALLRYRQRAHNSLPDINVSHVGILSLPSKAYANRELACWYTHPCRHCDPCPQLTLPGPTQASCSATYTRLAGTDIF